MLSLDVAEAGVADEEAGTWIVADDVAAEPCAASPNIEVLVEVEVLPFAGVEGVIVAMAI